jgi:AAA domain
MTDLAQLVDDGLEAIAREEAQAAAAAAGTAGFRLNPLTARAVCDLPEPAETDLLLGPLVVRRQRLIIVGDTGHGKTSLSYQIVAGILDERDVVGYVGAGSGPALIVDLEQGIRSIKRGLREAGLADRDDVLIVTVPDGLALDSEPAHKDELERVIAEHRPVVVLLDPYYKSHTAADPNAERPIVDLMRILDALRARHGFALILPAHPRKDLPGREGARKLTLADVAGSGAVTRGAEVVIGIERLAHGYGRLRILKDREGDLEVGEAWPLIFTRGEGLKLDPKEQTADEDLEQRILALADTLRTSKEWAAELGIREGRAKKILDRLAEADKIQVVVGPEGRSPKARCYGYSTSPALWEKSGAVTPSQPDSPTSPTSPDMLLGAVGSGSGATSPHFSGSSSGEVDADELERLLEKHHDIAEAIT